MGGLISNSIRRMEWNGQKIHEGADLVKADLAGARLAGAKLGTKTTSSASAADLTGADLRGANLTGANLIGVDFTMADLREATLDRAVLGRANFKAALLDGASFKGADFRGSIQKARPQKVDFRHASMVGASFVEANLQSVSIRDVDLTGADFSGADLLGAQLDGNLANADFTGARFPTWEGRDRVSDFLNRTVVSGDLTDVDLSHVGGIWVYISGSDLSCTEFGSADLSGKPFMESNWLEEHCDSKWYMPFQALPTVSFGSPRPSTAINWAGFRGFIYNEKGDYYPDWETVWPEGFNLETDGTVISDESEAISLLAD